MAVRVLRRSPEAYCIKCAVKCDVICSRCGENLAEMVPVDHPLNRKHCVAGDIDLDNYDLVCCVCGVLQQCRDGEIVEVE